MNLKVNRQNIALFAVPLAGIIAFFALKKKPIRYLAIELGGTSVRIAIIQQDPRDPTALKIIDNRILKTHTDTPEELINFIKNNFDHTDFSKIAISSFGPLCLKSGADFGKITAGSSPQKLPWVNFSLAQKLSQVFKKPAKIETDVNAAALAEHFLGFPGKGTSLAYITIGTGVGVGLIVHNKAVHGYQHPEGGHNM